MHASDPRDRKRPSRDLNLVPYIDLLTCLIAFLLITAVWTQLARLNARSQGRGEPSDEIPRPPVTVMVGSEGFNVVIDDHREILPRRGAGYDFAGLRAALEQLKRTLPDQENVLVASEDGITFDTLVGAMDTALAAGFPAVSLAEAKN